MQEIYYSGNIYTNNEKQEISKAMMVNDGSFVFVGDSEDVLKLKTDDTKVHNLKEKFVYPTFFDFKGSIFELITDRLKNAKKIKDIQNSDEINEDYENFANFDAYKKEYLKFEKELIEKGVSTIATTKVGKLEFAFWKKISEEKCLSIDVVGYVDIIYAKQVMDDNCVTYRNYRNHFRLGGYYLKIDGRIQELKAWLKKPYGGSKTYCGFSEVSEEQLYYLVKEALGERKQILYDVSGDKAIDEVLNVLKDVSEKEKITEFYRPMFYGAGIVDKKIYSKLKKFDITLIFENLDKKQTKKVNRFIGFARKNKFQNIKSLIDNNIRFIFASGGYEYFGIENFKNSVFFKNCNFVSKVLKSEENIKNFTILLNKLIYSNPAYVFFDQDKKETLETQKKANFIISENSIFEYLKEEKDFIKNVYIECEKKY